jgi:nanoRNase/pAp phosphatase (c-di-AMP/oligoRNAs hydrolase)
MNQQFDFAPTQQALTSAQTVLVAAPREPKFDHIASSLALFLSLKKAGKSVSIACPDEMTVEFSSLVGVDKVGQKLGGKNLMISFDYLEDSIEKVSYNIEENKFNLLIQPKVGFPPLSPDKVSYNYSGGSDLIFVIGAQKLEDLGKLYTQEKESYQQKTVINLDVDPQNSQFGKIDLLNPAASSCSEITASLIATLKLPIDQDVATNLLLGIEKATQGFSLPTTSALTFEMAAFCLRAGGRRTQVVKGKPEKELPFEPMPSGVSAKKPPQKPEEEKKPSSDWFEPKIFKGSTRV